jgi:hypothetical protein
MNRHTHVVLLAVVTLMLVIASTGWLLSSPGGATRAGRAIVLLVGALYAIRQIRRLPSASPAVLCTTVVGGIVLVAMPGGPLFPVALGVVVALAWAAVGIARSRTVLALTRALTGLWRHDARGRTRITRALAARDGVELSR